MIRLLSLTLGTLITSAAICFAQPLFDIRFDGDANGQAPEVSTEPDIDGLMTRPSFIRSLDGYGTVIHHLREELKQPALLISAKTEVNFIIPTAAFQEDRDFTLSFNLAYDEIKTDRTHYGLKISFYNTELSHEGYQAQVIFVPTGIRVISGEVDQTLPYTWSTSEVMKVQVSLLYSSNEMEIAINDWQAKLSLSPAKPAGIRAFEFGAGAESSDFVAAVADIQGSLK